MKAFLQGAALIVVAGAAFGQTLVVKGDIPRR
jgi:hypothetical protein